jgi:hypothetical protein
MMNLKAQPRNEAVEAGGAPAGPFGAPDEGKATYISGWAVKYAPQIKAHNEMVEKDGLWSDDLRLF